MTLTLAMVLAAITTTTRKELDIFALIGFLVWVLGFAFEVTTDTQKSRFRAGQGTYGMRFYLILT